MISAFLPPPNLAEFVAHQPAPPARHCDATVHQLSRPSGAQQFQLAPDPICTTHEKAFLCVLGSASESLELVCGHLKRVKVEVDETLRQTWFKVAEKPGGVGADIEHRRATDLSCSPVPGVVKSLQVTRSGGALTDTLL